MANGRDSNPQAMPIWVKVAGAIGLAAVVIIIAMLLLGGGEHGPGQHSGAVLPFFHLLPVV
jgi:hypothetical protein